MFRISQHFYGPKNLGLVEDIAGFRTASKPVGYVD
jgi:hypothetical protein